MERRLATIQRILDIIPHNNADTLEIAKILGWTCVVMKGQFQKDQLVVFIEPDAILPEGKPEWEFMRARHFRIKTIRLRGVISQGLVFPMSILDGEVELPHEPYQEGDNVTEILDITKYEPYIPADLRGLIKGKFPEFLHKTDEMRIQSVPDILRRHSTVRFIATEKVDGTSFTAYLNNGEFGVCSRNLELKEDDTNTYWKIARGLNLKDRLAKLGKNVAVQGELIGNGIQKNKYNLPDIQLKLFNIFDIDRGRYLCHDEFVKTAAELELDTVPVVFPTVVFGDTITVQALVDESKGPSLLNFRTPREGLVFRPETEMYDEDLRGRLSFKVINPEFLLKYDE